MYVHLIDLAIWNPFLSCQVIKVACGCAKGCDLRVMERWVDQPRGTQSVFYVCLHLVGITMQTQWNKPFKVYEQNSSFRYNLNSQNSNQRIIKVVGVVFSLRFLLYV